MKTSLLTRRYLAEYVRNPLNVVLLLVVPVIFVGITAGVLARFAELLGSAAGGASIEANTAGWAAAFIAGVASYFQVAGAREADRRLALSGFGASHVVAGRLVSALVLALLASGGALATLAVRTGIDEPGVTVAATVMFAVIYVAIGSMVAAVVRDPVNASVAILFVWFLDVFLSPTMIGGGQGATRFLPTHFVSLLVVGQPSGHAGVLGDIGISLAWTLGSVLVAVAVFVAATRPRARTSSTAVAPALQRLGAGLRFGFREYRRNVVLWLLLAIVPVVFITLAIAVTPDGPAPVELSERDISSVRVLSMVDVHGATMAPITVAFLAGLAGLFVVLGSAEGDRRLALAGFRSWEILTARIGVIGLVALLVTAASLLVTAVDFVPVGWLAFGGASLLVALTYGLIGAAVGPLVGRVGGLYLMFLLPFIDVGIAQNAMFQASPPEWARLFPAYGAMKVLMDAAFTPDFDASTGVMFALVWLVLVAVAAGVVFRRVAEPARA